MMKVILFALFIGLIMAGCGNGDGTVNATKLLEVRIIFIDN